MQDIATFTDPPENSSEKYIPGAYQLFGPGEGARRRFITFGRMTRSDTQWQATIDEIKNEYADYPGVDITHIKDRITVSYDIN